MRNLRRVLSHHRKSLARRRARAAMQGRPTEENNARNTKSDQGDGMLKKKWSLQEVQDIFARKAFNPQSPFLRIDVTDIKDKLAQFRDLEVPRNPVAKRIKIPSVRANCSCTIWRKAGSTVVEQLRGCEIQSKTLPTGERWASIKLDRPFEVPLAELQPDPNRPLPLGEAPSFSMELKLLAANLHDAWPPIDLKRVPAPKVAHFYDEADLVRLPILIAKWPRLPDIPRTPKECLLEMKAYQTSPSDQTKWVEYTPKLGIIVDMDWYENPSPLQQANGEIRQISAPQPRASPEPTSQVVGSTEWVFEGVLEKVPTRRYPAYHCPFCPLRYSPKQNQMRRFSGADEFCLHLRNNHPALRWEYLPKFSLVDGSGEISHDGKINIRPCREYDELARGTKGSDPRELDWARPKDPLDIEAFLRGDESWLGKKKRPNNMVAASRHSDNPRARGADMTRELIRRRTPDQIPDIPYRPRRTFPVPAAPKGVYFYRNLTKRVLQEGEEVSESDDDIDEEWLLQKHADTIDSFTDMTKEEKEFIIRFDRHMLREDIASDLHANEALIRFCRANKRWLRRDDMRQEFLKKVASLKIQGAVPSKIIWACTAIINAPLEQSDADEPTAEATAGLLKTNYGADPVEKGHIYGRCPVCKHTIRDPRKLLRCTNPTCQHPDHHMGCVYQGARVSPWLCATCKTPTAPHLRYASANSSISGFVANGYTPGPPYSTYKPTPPASAPPMGGGSMFRPPPPPPPPPRPMSSSRAEVITVTNNGMSGGGGGDRYGGGGGMGSGGIGVVMGSGMSMNMGVGGGMGGMGHAGFSAPSTPRLVNGGLERTSEPPAYGYPSRNSFSGYGMDTPMYGAGPSPPRE